MVYNAPLTAIGLIAVLVLVSSDPRIPSLKDAGTEFDFTATTGTVTFS